MQCLIKPDRYNYTTDCDGTVISAADNIEDVDEDGESVFLLMINRL